MRVRAPCHERPPGVTRRRSSTSCPAATALMSTHPNSKKALSTGWRGPQFGNLLRCRLMSTPSRKGRRGLGKLQTAAPLPSRYGGGTGETTTRALPGSKHMPGGEYMPRQGGGKVFLDTVTLQSLLCPNTPASMFLGLVEPLVEPSGLLGLLSCGGRAATDETMMLPFQSGLLSCAPG